MRSRWLSRGAPGYRPVVVDPRDEHFRLERAFSECPGLWVAVDRRTGVIRAAGPTPYELAAKLKSDQIGDVDVIRAPGVGEPEVVGFG